MKIHEEEKEKKKGFKKTVKRYGIVRTVLEYTKFGDTASIIKFCKRTSQGFFLAR